MKCSLGVCIFFHFPGSRFLHNQGHGWPTGPKRSEVAGGPGPCMGASICSLLCESGGLDSRSHRRYGLGLSGAVCLFTVFSQNSVVSSIPFSCDPGNSGLGPSPPCDLLHVSSMASKPHPFGSPDPSIQGDLYKET